MRPADASARSEDTDAVAAPSPSNPNARVCGDCTACCRVMAVTALGKSAGEPCRHQQGGGCGVYARRPEACREFHCLWLRDDRGIFDASHRPDRLGLVLGDRDDGTGARTAVAAREVRPGAAEEPAAAEVIAFLRQFVPVQVVPARTPAASAACTLTIEGRAA